MVTPRMLTVDQAAELLGLSRRGVIELIGDGTLPWTLAADKRTVLVETPADRKTCLPKIGASRQSVNTVRQQSLTSQPDSSVETLRRGDARRTISDLDAWSQPK
jgi:hypothetical protein